jgi:hypothetical protein
MFFLKSNHVKIKPWDVEVWLNDTQLLISWFYFNLGWNHNMKIKLGPKDKVSWRCIGYFRSSKNFNHIAKDANFFHLKLGCSPRLNYLSTPTPSARTSHHHRQPIVGDQFLTWRNKADLL